MFYKQKMFFVISALVIIGFLSISITSYYIARQAAIETLTQTELPLAQDNIYSEVQRDILAPKIVSSVMANDTFVTSWIADGENDPSEIVTYLSRMTSEYNAFTAFIVVESSRNFYTPIGLMRVVHPAEPRDEWYFRVRENPTQVELNIDPAESNDDALTIFINVPIVNENDEFLGAVGLGLNIDTLQTKLENYREKYDRQVFFIDQYGDILLHEDESFQGENIDDLPGLRSIADNLNDQTDGEYRYEENNADIILQTRYIQELDLTLVISAEVGDITKGATKVLLINLSVCLFITVIILYLLISTLRTYQSKLEDLAWSDELTGISNRQAFKAHYDKNSPDKSAILLLIDVDDFKAINDKKGHLAGDNVLRELAQEMEQLVGRQGKLARWGGEEFIVLLNNHALADAVTVAEKLRAAIESSSTLAQYAGNTVTVSIGVSQVSSDQDIYRNIDAADKCLYQAKEAGKNRVVSLSN